MGKDHEPDIAFIEALARLLRDNDLTELQVKREWGTDDALNVRVSRHAPPPPQAAAAPAPFPAQAPAAPAPAPQAAPAPAASGGDPAQDPGAVTSPMVGTVYLSAEPGAPPFVQVGDAVSEGDPLLIVEAMKTMNQIPAPRAGTVRRVLVEDGGAVEFGAPLVILD